MVHYDLTKWFIQEKVLFHCLMSEKKLQFNDIFFSLQTIDKGYQINVFICYLHLLYSDEISITINVKISSIVQCYHLLAECHAMCQTSTSVFCFTRCPARVAWVRHGQQFGQYLLRWQPKSVLLATDEYHSIFNDSLVSKCFTTGSLYFHNASHRCIK